MVVVMMVVVMIVMMVIVMVVAAHVMVVYDVHVAVVTVVPKTPSRHACHRHAQEHPSDPLRCHGSPERKRRARCIPGHGSAPPRACTRPPAGPSGGDPRHDDAAKQALRAQPR
jgi:hypothetical protein